MGDPQDSQLRLRSDAGVDDDEDASERSPDPPLAGALGVEDLEARIGDARVKEQLRSNTDEAISRGVFGVPTFAIDDELFWGEDATGMMLDYLDDPELFQRGDWARLNDLPIASARKESRV